MENLDLLTHWWDSTTTFKKETMCIWWYYKCGSLKFPSKILATYCSSIHLPNLKLRLLPVADPTAKLVPQSVECCDSFQGRSPRGTNASPEAAKRVANFHDRMVEFSAKLDGEILKCLFEANTLLTILLGLRGSRKNNKKTHDVSHVPPVFQSGKQMQQ